MKFSIAKWIALILGSTATVAISTYFYLDAKDMMIPALAIIIKPFMIITLSPLVLLLAARLMAYNKEDKRISGKIVIRAMVLLAALLSYKLFTGYFSK